MDKKKEYCVYKHTTPNGKVYIGQTKQSPKYRWQNGEGYRNQIFYYAIKKYGWNNIKHEILFENLTKEEADKIEIELIDIYNSTNSKYGYNKDLGGSSHSEETGKKISMSKMGHFVSEETRKKLSVAASGRKHTEEEIRKQSEKQKGRKLSEETKRKISESNKGKRKNYTEEGLKRLSEFNKGRPCAQKSLEKTRKPVICIETDIIYESLQDAENKTGISRKNIGKVCNGDKYRKTAGGYHWMFYDEYLKLINEGVTI